MLPMDGGQRQTPDAHAMALALLARPNRVKKERTKQRNEKEEEINERNEEIKKRSLLMWVLYFQNCVHSMILEKVHAPTVTCQVLREFAA